MEIANFFKRKQPPFVSIIMPVWNREKYISESIQSFLNQSYKNAELIIVDDASSDSTFEIAQEIADKDPRIKVFKNKKNLGIPTTRNIALSKARGKFIGHLDSDDLIVKDAIKTCIKVLSKNKVALVYSGCIIINSRGEKIGEFMGAKFNRFELHKLGWRHFGMYRKDVAISLGGFNEKLIHCSDADLFMRIVENYNIKRVKEYLYIYRKHFTNICNKRPHCLKCSKQEFCKFFEVWNKIRINSKGNQ